MGKCLLLTAQKVGTKRVKPHFSLSSHRVKNLSKVTQQDGRQSWVAQAPGEAGWKRPSLKSVSRTDKISGPQIRFRAAGFSQVALDSPAQVREEHCSSGWMCSLNLAP